MFGFSRKQQSVLHLTWVAFFLTFMAWFNMAPFNTTILKTTGLTIQQIDILMICNVALTIPARILIGTFVDRFGPRLVFSALLLYSSAVCFYFSQASAFSEFLVSRLLMGVSGAGFVVGIKMIAEWFPPEKMGTAQGIYAGWGNFGAAAAAFSLPLIAALFPQDTGWRVATAVSGGLCLLWSGVYFIFSREVPSRGENFKVGLINSIPVTSRKDLVLQILLMIPIYGSVLAVVWKLYGHPLFLLSPGILWILLTGLITLFVFSMLKCIRSNLPHLLHPVPGEHYYEFRQIFILSLVYALTFGSNLAVISMFPEFLESTFDLSVIAAGVLGSSFAFMNLITRPCGGWLSDIFGRRRTLFILVLGSMAGYLAMSRITSAWPLWSVLALAVTCSVFLQAGSGACFAMVPLIRKDLTGKMAGLAGAYGNVGAVLFLTILSFVEEQTFFEFIGWYACLVLSSLVFLQSFKTLHVSYK
ncbi:MAG: MFS transporter [Nitrospinaceae bacterium]